MAMGGQGLMTESKQGRPFEVLCVNQDYAPKEQIFEAARPAPILTKQTTRVIRLPPLLLQIVPTPRYPL